MNFPTREENTLDLNLTSLPGQFQEIHSPDKLSDHDMVAGTLKVLQGRNHCLRFICIRRVTLTLWGEIFKTLRRTNISMVIPVLALFRKNFYLITSFIEEAVDKYITTKIRRLVASVPWITSEIRRNIRKQNKTHAKAIETGSRKFRSKFQEFRQKIKADIKNSMICLLTNWLVTLRLTLKTSIGTPTVREKTIRVSLLSKGAMVVVGVQ